jgi:type IV fimbrial biogenesis protein FimT
MQAAARGSKLVRGVTLVEVCVVGAMAAILAGAALPSFTESLNKRKFDGAVAEIPTEVNFARSAAVSSNRVTWLSYTQVVGGTCAMVHVGAKTDCSCTAGGQSVCANGGEALKVGLHAVPVSIALPIHFDPTNGSVSPTATIRVEYAAGKELHHKVNIMGRVRSCSPMGAIKGYAIC